MHKALQTVITTHFIYSDREQNMLGLSQLRSSGGFSSDIKIALETKAYVQTLQVKSFKMSINESPSDQHLI